MLLANLHDTMTTPFYWVLWCTFFFSATYLLLSSFPFKCMVRLQQLQFTDNTHLQFSITFGPAHAHTYIYKRMHSLNLVWIVILCNKLNFEWLYQSFPFCLLSNENERTEDKKIVKYHVPEISKMGFDESSIRLKLNNVQLHWIQFRLHFIKCFRFFYGH